jgi:tetratricopeptide (TPR) repeat protein
MKSQLLTPSLCLALAASLLFSGCTAKARAQRHIKRGDGYYAKAQWQSAKLEYMNAVRRGAREPSVLSRLGECFLKDGEIGPAYQCLSEARTAQPTNIVARQAVGALLLNFGQTKKARDEAEAILDLAPADQQGLVLLAESSISPQEIAGAKARIEKLAPSSATNAVLPFALAELALKVKDFGAARSNYQRAIELEPKRSQFHLALGRFAASQHDTNTADASFKTAVALAPVRSPERLTYAEFLKQQKRTDEAQKFVEQTIAQAPDFLQAINVLTELLLEQGKIDESEKSNLKALALAPANRDALIRRAQLKLMRKDKAGALADLLELSKTRGRDAVVQYQLAVAYIANGDSAKARAALDTAVTLDPKLANAALLRCELQLKKREFAAAIPELTRLTREFPSAPDAYYLLANAYRQRGTHSDALPIYNALAQAFPANPQPFYLMGLTFREMKKPAEARQAFDKALKIAPDYLAPVEQLTDLDINENSLDAAMARLQPYLQRNPNRSATYCLQAKVLAASKKPEDAARMLQKALDLEPDSVPIQRMLVELYNNTGKTQEAVARLNIILQKNPNDIDALAYLGLLQEQAKDFKSARATYESILKINPDLPGVLNNLATILSDQFHEQDAAFQYAKRARELAPDDPSVADTFGWLLWKKGDYSGAIPLLEQAAGGLPQTAEVKFHLGMAYYMTGNEERALAALQGAEVSKQHFSGKDTLQNALAVLKVSPSNTSDKDVAFLRDAVKKTPGDLMAQLRLAQIAERQKQWEQAAKSYEVVLKLYPRSTNVITHLADLNTFKLSNLPRGLDYAKQAWTISQDDLMASLVGPIGFAAGDFKWALAPLSQAHGAHPDNADVTLKLALTCYGLGKLDQAKDLLGDVQSSSPLAGLAKSATTLIDYQLGATDSATATAGAAAALKINPDFAPALIVSGLLAEEKKDSAGARADYEKLLRIAPSHVMAQRQLGLLLAQKAGDDPKAAELLTAARSRLPGDATIAKALGKIAFRRADYAEAVKLLNDASLTLKNDSDLLYHLGLAQYQLNDRQARTSLTQALKVDSNSTMAASARSALQAMK